MSVRTITDVYFVLDASAECSRRKVQRDFKQCTLLKKTRRWWICILSFHCSKISTHGSLWRFKCCHQCVFRSTITHDGTNCCNECAAVALLCDKECDVCSRKAHQNLSALTEMVDDHSVSFSFTESHITVDQGRQHWSFGERMVHIHCTESTGRPCGFPSSIIMLTFLDTGMTDVLRWWCRRWLNIHRARLMCLFRCYCWCSVLDRVWSRRLSLSDAFIQVLHTRRLGIALKVTTIDIVNKAE